MNLFTIFIESSIMVQFVMVVLVIMSILSWGIIIWKIRVITREKSRLKSTMLLIKQRNITPDVINKMKDGTVGTHISIFISKANNSYANSVTQEDNVDSKERAENHLQSMLYTYNSSLKRGCSTLGTIASSAPYIGLFGTVCGILVSFQGLATVKVATLQTVAPGIVEALVATAVGLLTAIPALIAAHALTRAGNAIMGDLQQTKQQILLSINASHKKKQVA